MTNKPVPLCERIYNEKIQKPLNTEVALPEYCPGVERIIVYDAKAHVSQCSFTDGVIYISGNCIFNVIYKSDYKQKVKCVTFNVDFSHSFDATLLSEYDESDLHIDSSVLSISPAVTLINGRRLSLSVNLLMSASADICTHMPLYKDFDVDCQTLNKTVVCTQNKFLPDARFSVNEQISLESQMPAIADIIYCDALVCTNSIRTLNNQLEIAGTICLYCLYEAQSDEELQNGSYILLQKELPFTHNASTDGFDGPFEVCHKISVTDTKCEPTVDSYGENKIINSNIGIEIKNIELISNKNFDICTDAFSTCFESEAKTDVFACKSVGNTIHTTAICEETIKCDLGNITEIMLCHAQIENAVAEIVDTKLCISAKANICTMGTGENGEIYGANATAPIHITLPAPEKQQNASFVPTVQVSEISCKVQNGALNTVMKLSLWCTVQNNSTFCAVSDFKIFEDRPLDSNCDYITVYYPEKSETLWETAKKYAISPQKISNANKEENTPALIIPCRD